ncbi:MAG: hypothetical protein JST32_01255 [Bacteroidetes bacterium]|nr:hypothetical protein [Bacteroidota bacterium]
MTRNFKKTFVIISVGLPFLLYCVYYYAHVFKNAPYKFTEFKSFKFEYGVGDSLVNKYNSATGKYQYVNSHDSLVKMNLFLTSKELKTLHDTAAMLGFWDWPTDETGDSTIRHNGQRSPRYVMEFNYQRKSKKIKFDESFDGDERLKDANRHMVKEILHVLAVAESRKKDSI